MKALQSKIHKLLLNRDDKIVHVPWKSGGTYEALAEISRHIELLAMELRDSLIGYHYELEALGHHPLELPMPDAPDIDVRIEGKSVRIVMGGILPYPLKGPAYYLHRKLDVALLRYAQENALPRPLFTERCAVVFIHHYAADGRAIRNMRDYDNVERRCITNVIARRFLRDDSPACYISMDILAPGETTCTEIRLLTIPAFRALVLSDEITYLP